MRKYLTISIAMLVLAMSSSRALAVKIADITRIDGERTNVLTGLGLVYGLKGTGDGGDFQPAIKPLVTMLGKFADSSTVKELASVQNVALVSITATIPSTGARNGDHLDVYITSIGAAGSLRGGRLFITPLQGPSPAPSPEGAPVFAFAEGPVILEDPASPTVGVVKGGCVMEADISPTYIQSGKLSLVIEDPSASWTTSSTIAKIINDAESTTGETLAIARDPKVVEITIPPIERERPDSFISRVQRLPVPLLPTEARVQINERTGTMIITGDVEISACVISQRGLTITMIAPPPVPSPRAPLLINHDFIPLDTTQPPNAKLQQLVAMLDQLKVPAEDRITIVKELYKTGKLHAKLIIE